jgi:transcriptional regulator with XRE-family HTH domain
LTQAELAARAGIPRSNLCAVERGIREVTLMTLRALAAALDVRPGVLADGLGPHRTEAPPQPLSRQDLERIAEAVVTGASGKTPTEDGLIGALRRVTRQRHAAQHGSPRRLMADRRATEAAWLLVRSAYPPATLRTLFERIAEHDHGTD